jgi:hypothetical protein
MGRAILKTLKESTLLTFFKVCKEIGLKKDIDYKYNSMSSIITFKNESEIYLKDLFSYPSDPEFDELGSTEYTAAFIDEASQVSHKAYMIVMSRLRYKLDEYDIIPKILTATNPTKNFLYAEFYKPSKLNQLKPYRKFVPALVTDNQFISKYYIENLKKLDEISKQRLLLGNWEYDDDPTRLFDYEDILEIFEIPYVEIPRENKYLSVDVARYGNDKTVIILWKNWFISNIYSFDKKDTKETSDFIKYLCQKEAIPFHNVIIDEDGVGGGVVDNLRLAKGFVNNSSAIEKLDISENVSNFYNLKSQCYYYLSEMVKQHQIGCYKEIPIEFKKRIIEDLEQIKRYKPDEDKKLQVIPKEKIKEIYGKSPDFSDAIMMRCYFLLKPKTRPYLSIK